MLLMNPGPVTLTERVRNSLLQTDLQLVLATAQPRVEIVAKLSAERRRLAAYANEPRRILERRAIRCVRQQNAHDRIARRFDKLRPSAAADVSAARAEGTDQREMI